MCPGGALVTNDRLLIVLESGGIFTLDAITGATIDAASAVPGGLAGAVAVSNNTIYAPSRRQFGLRLSRGALVARYHGQHDERPDQARLGRSDTRRIGLRPADDRWPGGASCITHAGARRASSPHPG